MRNINLNRTSQTPQLLVFGALIMLFAWLLLSNTFAGERIIRRAKSRGNKDDHVFLLHFSKLLNELGFCDSSHVIAVGGLNQGQGAKVLLENCPNIRLYGFEISPTELEAASKNLAQFPNVVYNNLGMGDVNDLVHFTDYGEKGGLFGKDDTAPTVEVVPLAEYFAENTELLTYLLIDVEGYEPIVIDGMGLQHEQNRRRFPIFQYELGGTWAEHDPRHPKGSMNQFEIALFLMNRGYELFMIGESDLYRIPSAAFFHQGDRDEGKGLFVQGNVLAVHPDYTDARILDWVKSKVI